VIERDATFATAFPSTPLPGTGRASGYRGAAGTAVVAAVAVDGGAAGAGLLYTGVGAAVLVA